MALGNRNAVQSAAQVASVHKPRSKFNLSKTTKGTILFDELIPIYMAEVIPGDTFNYKLQSFGRLATQIAPLMDNLYIDYFYFFVPNRLVWNNWPAFQGEKEPDQLNTVFTMPKTTNFSPSPGSIYDYMGVPPTPGGIVINNNLPARAYYRIFNEWFRDEDLQDSVTVPLGDGPDNPLTLWTPNGEPMKRGRRFDYFAACRPWPQKGTAVQIPVALNGTAPVVLSSTLNLATEVRRADTHALYPTSPSTSALGSDGGLLGGGASYVNKVVLDPNGAWEAEINSQVGTIRDLTEAWMVQQLLETDARHGTRYVESIYGRYGVISPDFRLQRTEFLGGGTATVNSHPVVQTSETDTSEQATLASFGVTSNSGSIGFAKTFTEHGIIIGIACPRADVTYQQGMSDKIWDKSEFFDFYYPDLAMLGEQPVLNKEIYLQADSVLDPITNEPVNEMVFGYNEAWAHMKQANSYVFGDLRSDFATPLDQWHMADDYANLPVLNDEWIVQDTPIERNLAVDPTGFSTAELIMDFFHQVHVTRIMPVHSIPAKIGKF